MHGDWQATKVWWVTQRYHDTKRLQGGHKGTRTRQHGNSENRTSHGGNAPLSLLTFRWCWMLAFGDDLLFWGEVMCFSLLCRLAFRHFFSQKTSPTFSLNKFFFRVCRDVCFIIIIRHMKWRIPCFLRRIQRRSWEIAPHHPLSTNQGLGKEILTPATFDWLSVMGMLKRSRPIAKSSIGGRRQKIESVTSYMSTEFNLPSYCRFILASGIAVPILWVSLVEKSFELQTQHRGLRSRANESSLAVSILGARLRRQNFLHAVFHF
jgi:hypothetical protein